MNTQRTFFTRRRLLIGGLLAVHAVFAWCASFKDFDGPVLQTAVDGVALGQPTLLAAWGMLGPASRWLQIPRALLLACGALGLTIISAGTQNVHSLVGVPVFELVVFVATLGLFGVAVVVRGWRLMPQEVKDRASANRLRQISLRRIFLDVSLAALVLAMGRMLPEPLPVSADDREIFMEPTSPASLFAFVLIAPLLPILVLVTGNWRQARWWFAGVLVCSALIGLLMAKWPLRDSILVFVTVLCAGAASAAVSFFVIRLAGYRLINRRTLSAPVPEQTARPLLVDTNPAGTSAESHVRQ